MRREIVIRLAALAMVFVLGTISGIALSGLWLVHKLRHPKPVPEVTSNVLSLSLRLDREQRAALRPIVERTYARLVELELEVRPEVDVVLEQATDELRPLLRPKQQERLDRLIERREQRLRDKYRVLE